MGIPFLFEGQFNILKSQICGDARANNSNIQQYSTTADDDDDVVVVVDGE